MSCCGNNCASGIDKFFSKEAARFLKRYKKKGLEKSQKNLFQGIQQTGISNQTILEIGCGVGYFHSQLIKAGAKKATGIDISKEMIGHAKNYMKEIGLDKRTDYHVGDFVEISEDIGSADITVLDKVICCYPDAEDLVEKSISRTKHVYAFTLPRDRWWIKYPIKLVVAVLKIFRSSFHPYFHEHSSIHSRLESGNFKMDYQNHVFFWETYVFIKN
ncbi:MAG: class I SAM-dependent methyltransferase [Spirochaetia bacterium]|nr:class I SAM-dependent methyltransferase [Spirochaetia bacterium]